MQEGWSEKYKKSIDCSNPKGFSQKAHCQGKKKEEVKEDLRKWFGTGGKGGVGGGGWDRYNTKGERIGKCAREPGEPKPKCLSKEKAAKMSKDEIAAAVRRKRKKDPVADRPGKGGKPKMVSNKINEGNNDPCWDTHKQVGMKKKGKKMVPNCVPKEEVSPIVARVLDRHFATEELEKLEEENKPTNPKLWSRAKALAKQKFDVYPSAYANGWASKWYKSKGGGWKSTKSEEVEQTQETIEEATRIPSQSGNVYLVAFTWRGKYMVMKLFFPEIKRPSRNEVQDALDKVYPGCTLQRFDPTVFQPSDAILNVGVKEGSELKYCPKCKKLETRSDCAYGGSYWDENAKDVSTNDDGSMEVSEGAAWTRKEGQNKEGGLNEKGRKSYEAENPGSDLKAPSKKVGNPRRKSFCARMSGMKKKLTSKKTASDPDSRINKSLRAWNC